MKHKAYAIVANELTTGELWAFCYHKGSMRMSQNFVTLFSSNDERGFWAMNHLFDRTHRRNSQYAYTTHGYLGKVRKASWQNLELCNVRVVRVSSEKSPIIIDWKRYFHYINKYNSLQRYSDAASAALGKASLFKYTEV